MPDPVTRLNAALEGRYAIERELREGGMATVYLAEDIKHNRRVALKVLKPELAAVVGAERFLAEIQVTANLQHPHILPLFDSGEADSFLFYVMPYVEGETLRDRIKREKQLPVDEAVGIATAVANALDYAHRHKVIHRDIKPANILIQDGEPVVSDFGIALALGAGGGDRLTETGLSLGTPYYMSPEQATGDQPVGSSTDTYALGSVLYEMLVGEPPYPGTTTQAVLGKIIAGKPVSATEHRPSVPTNVDAAIRCAIEKLPADRFGSVQDFVRALADPGFQHGEVVAGGVVVGRTAWSPLQVAVACVALVSTLGLGWSLLQPEPPEPVSRHVLGTGGWAGLDGPRFGEYAALAPDGSSMILPVGDQLALKMRNSTEITPIPGTEGGRNPVYSPDGQWIAYAVGSEVFKRPLVVGAPVRLAEDVEPAPFRVGLAWLDDGTILYEPEDPTTTTIVQIPEDGGEPLVVFEPDNLRIWWVHGLPDARGALVVTTDNALHVVDLRDLSSEVILEEVVRAWYTPTGHVVYVREDGALFAVPFDLDALELRGSATPLFEGVRTNGATADMHLAADGTLVYAEGGSTGWSRAPVWLSRDGPEGVLDPALSWTFGAPAISPDGRQIALEYNSPGGDTPQDIWVYDLDQQTFSRLTFEGAFNRYPFWSPDGREVGFSSDRDGLPALYARPADLSGETRLLLADPDDALHEGSWTPDGRRLVYRRGSVLTNGILDLWQAAPDSDSAATVILETPATEQNPSLSPDGRWLAYVSDESGQNEIYVRPFPGPGGRQQISTDAGVNPVWAHGGQEIFYLAGGGVLTVASFRADPAFTVESREELFSWGGLYNALIGHPEWDLAPNDRRILAIGAPSQVAEAGSRYVLVQNFFEELKKRVPN